MARPRPGLLTPDDLEKFEALRTKISQFNITHPNFEFKNLPIEVSILGLDDPDKALITLETRYDEIYLKIKIEDSEEKAIVKKRQNWHISFHSTKPYTESNTRIKKIFEKKGIFHMKIGNQYTPLVFNEDSELVVSGDNPDLRAVTMLSILKAVLLQMDEMKDSESSTETPAPEPAPLDYEDLQAAKRKSRVDEESEEEVEVAAGGDAPEPEPEPEEEPLPEVPEPLPEVPEGNTKGVQGGSKRKKKRKSKRNKSKRKSKRKKSKKKTKRNKRK